MILFAPTDDEIFRVSTSGGEITRVTQLEASAHEAQHMWPEFLPDGRRFLCRTWDPARHEVCGWVARFRWRRRRPGPKGSRALVKVRRVTLIAFDTGLRRQAVTRTAIESLLFQLLYGVP